MNFLVKRREENKIYPLDLNKNIGIGISLPFNANAVFNTTYTTKDAIKFNLINTLLTNPGERPMNPLFGAGLRRQIFTQNEQVNRDQIEDIIKYNIDRYIQGIDLVDVSVSTNDDSVLVIKIDYSVNKEFDFVVINFEA